MANQIEPRMHLAVTVAADGTIRSRTATVTAVTHPAPGVYHVQFNNPIGVAEEAHALCTDVIDLIEDVGESAGSCVRISETDYEIHTYDQASHAADVGFSFAMYRVSSSNGT